MGPIKPERIHEPMSTEQEVKATVEFKQAVETALERFMDGLYTTDDVVLSVHSASENYKKEVGQ